MFGTNISRCYIHTHSDVGYKKYINMWKSNVYNLLSSQSYWYIAYIRHTEREETTRYNTNSTLRNFYITLMSDSKTDNIVPLLLVKGLTFWIKINTLIKCEIIVQLPSILAHLIIVNVLQFSLKFTHYNISPKINYSAKR